MRGTIWPMNIETSRVKTPALCPSTYGEQLYLSFFAELTDKINIKKKNPLRRSGNHARSIRYDCTPAVQKLR